MTAVTIPMRLADVEREVILHTLEHYYGDKPRTVAALGISLRSLYNKLAVCWAAEQGWPT